MRIKKKNYLKRQRRLELGLHMQLNYKQAVEIAEEQALNVLFEGNNYELIKKQILLRSNSFRYWSC